jgi:hypothetical protein
MVIHAALLEQILLPGSVPLALAYHVSVDKHTCMRVVSGVNSVGLGPIWAKFTLDPGNVELFEVYDRSVLGLNSGQIVGCFIRLLYGLISIHGEGPLGEAQCLLIFRPF